MGESLKLIKATNLSFFKAIRTRIFCEVGLWKPYFLNMLVGGSQLFHFKILALKRSLVTEYHVFDMI